MSDLFGADLPVDGQDGVQFAWKNGPFLKALQSGDWIILDEVSIHVKIISSCNLHNSTVILTNR